MVVKRRYRIPYEIAVKSDIKNTIGEKRSILVGRMMLRRKSSLGEMPESSLERRSWLPVSFRRRAALRARMTGAYVSRIQRNVMREQKPL